MAEDIIKEKRKSSSRMRTADDRKREEGRVQWRQSEIEYSQYQ